MYIIKSIVLIYIVRFINIRSLKERKGDQLSVSTVYIDLIRLIDVL